MGSGEVGTASGSGATWAGAWLWETCRTIFFLGPLGPKQGGLEWQTDGATPVCGSGACLAKGLVLVLGGRPDPGCPEPAQLCAQPQAGCSCPHCQMHEKLWSEKSVGRRGCESFRESPRRRASQRCDCALWGPVPLPVCL